ncbi:MAG: PTS sugar transporter subunit IIA [Acidobacteria bacterium]|nr:PTS sugar transporter subunit IIA [Acidobacteriota bacterium]
MNIQDAARYLGVNQQHIHHWQEHEFLPGSGLETEDLDAFCHCFQLQKPIGDVLTDVPWALMRGGFIRDIDGSSVDEVLENALAAMELHPQANREMILNALKERERISSTGVGHGIAFPHVSSPSSLDLPYSSICLVQLKRAIPYFSFDQKEVNLLFVLLVPQTQAHLKILQQLAKNVRNPVFRETIAAADGIQAVIDALE